MSSVFLSPGRHHAVWKEWRRIARGKDERFFLEHRRAVLESLEGSRPPRQVLLSEALFAQDPEGWERRARAHAGVNWYLLDGKAIDDVASVPHNSGLCAVFDPAPVPFQTVLEKRFLLVAWELSDPGNLGTVIRAVTALGDGGVLAVGGCDPWSAKVARSSAGSLLKADVARIALADAEPALDRLQAAGFALYGAFPRAEVALDRLAWPERSAVLLGNETRGLPNALAGRLQAFKIPTGDQVESLNVAMAGAIIAWEWRRAALSGQD